MNDNTDYSPMILYGAVSRWMTFKSTLNNPFKTEKVQLMFLYHLNVTHVHFIPLQECQVFKLLMKLYKE